MGLNIQFAPVEDAGTGEVSQSLDPITHEADDVDNHPDPSAVDLPATVTHEADAIAVESTGGDDLGPVTTVADWPPHGEDKAISDGEAKATPAKKAAARKATPAKKAAARKAAAKEKS